MSPAHVRRPRNPRRLLIGAGALIVIGGVAWLALWLLSPRPRPTVAPGTPVAAVVVRESVTPIIVRGLGQVQAYNTDVIKSRVDGNIVDIRYREGQEVTGGDLLVQIDPRPFEVQLAQAQAALARDSAQLENAQRDLGRDVQLVGPGLVTRQSFDAQRYQVRQFNAALKADRAAIGQARLNLVYAAVRAPFSGRAGVRLIDLGNLVQADQTSLVVITQMKPIFVLFTLPERDLSALRAAMRKGSVEVVAFDGDDEHALATGQLTVLDNSVDTSTGTVRLKAQYANRDEMLWPGEFVNAHVIVERLERAITVPLAAVQEGPDGPFVFRVTASYAAQVVPVEVGQIEGGEALITRGLKSGDWIVVDGAYGLTQGQRVTITNRGEASYRAPAVSAASGSLGSAQPALQQPVEIPASE